MPLDKIDSNSTNLAIAEETTPKVLPGTPVWYGLEPNSYNDFGGKIDKVAREPISGTRQRKKGTTTDLDASGGFNIDVTQNNLTRLLQGFLFANAYEKADTQGFNTTAIPITSATSTTYVAASGLGVFKTGDLVLGTGFGVAANNGLKVLSAATGTTLTTTGNSTEASPPAAARVQVCGFQFPSGDLAMSVSSGVLTLTATVTNLTTLGLKVGEWFFIGGDSAAFIFATGGSGYARVKTITSTTIVCDKVTNSGFVTDSGSGKTIRLFFGKYNYNENVAANIKTRTYNLERQLGSDGVGIQSEYLEGAVPNEFSLKVPSANKLNADLSYIAMGATYRNGTTGVKSGTRVNALGESAFNTSSNVYRIRMTKIDPTTLVPTALFAYITEGSIDIKNNASLAKAVGTLGGIGITVGNFEVGGNVTAYFSTIDATAAVVQNADVTIDMIMAKDNAGMVFDIPLLALGDGRLSVQKDNAITVPLETIAAENAAGYTLSITNFPYLPTIAMPA